MRRQPTSSRPAVDARRIDEVEYAPFSGMADVMEHVYDYLEFLAKTATIVVAIVAVIVHLTWIPLDVLWYVALRRLGM